MGNFTTRKERVRVREQAIFTERISPIRARTYLENAAPNRTVSDLLVTKYAVAMLDGQWYDTGAPIVFDGENRLADGQHRLHAVIESETSQDFAVVRGVDFAAMLMAVDTGRRRTVKDVLKIITSDETDPRTFKYVESVPVAARSLIAIAEVGDPYKNGRYIRTIPEQRVLEFIFKNQVALEEASRIGTRIQRVVPITLSALTIGFYLFDQIAHEDALDFADELLSPSSLDGNPAYVLQKQALKDRTHRQPTFANDLRLSLAYLIKAWNAFRAGKDVVRLQFRSHGAMAESYPVPN